MRAIRVAAGHRNDEAHRPGNSNCRRAAYGERSDGLTDVVQRAQLALDTPFGQLSLIDDDDGLAIITPSDASYDWHALKLR